MDYDLFDIIGPVMIGPSSSHTAGAARLGYLAGKIAAGKVLSVTFRLHGSFALTKQGHGTDKALLAGVLGIKPQDENLREAFALAAQKNIRFYFLAADLGDVHPNSVEIIMDTAEGQRQVQGCSIGGGRALIKQIDHLPVEISGDLPTLITFHQDQPGVLADITRILAQSRQNVASLRLFRAEEENKAIMVLETDEALRPDLFVSIKSLPQVDQALLLTES